MSVWKAEEIVGNDEKSREERIRKGKILEKVCQEAQKANDGLTYGIMPLFNWAGGVDVSISPVDIMHDKPTPLANINKSGDVFSITNSATAPTTPTPTPVNNPINPKHIMNPITLANIS